MSSKKTKQQNKSEEHKKKISESVKRYHQSLKLNKEKHYVIDQDIIAQQQKQINKLENQLLNSNSIDRDSIIENIFKMQTKIKQGSYVSQTELIDDLNLLLKSI
jgi:transcription elongation GreA/GreB family factor